MKLKFWLWGLAGALAASVLAAAVGVGFENRPADGSSTKRFQIPEGQALSVTADRLAAANLVRNPQMFRWIYQFRKGDGSFPSGTFQVPGGLSVWDAAGFFRTARPLDVRVTVTEGLTSTKIARMLEEAGVVAAQDFLDVVKHPEKLGALGQGLTSLEGRLFPDTYRFPVDSRAEDIAATFVSTFRARTAAWSSLPSEDFEKTLVLASIVEREYRVPDEAPLIASVFLNRLEKRIALGSCATIEYILTEIQGRPHPHRIYFVHTQIPSPYNTYLNRGLPPGPIANPGLTALRAAFEPAKTKYLYFVVADPAKGSHTFSALWSQHEAAKAAYLSSFVTKG